MKLRSALLIITLTINYLLHAEGSKNLTPAYGSGDGTTNNSFIGYLCHSQEGGITGNFLVPGSSADERLYVYIKQGESLYMGLRRIDPVTNNEARHQDLTIVIRENDGTLVTSFTLDDNDAVTDANGDSQGYPFTIPQTGVIESYAEVLAGPQQIVGGSGYDALEWENTSLGDQEFYIEFIQFDGGSTNPANDIYVESWYDLWDFSVYDGNEEKPGRLHSKNWGFTAGSYSNQFADEFEMYVTVPSVVNGTSAGSYIKKIDFAGIQPYTTLVYANSSGAILASTTDLNGDGVIDFQDTRRSQTGNIGDPEFDMFINNPDLDIYPTTVLPSITITDANFFCNPAGSSGAGVITFTANQSGIITILLDLNGVTGYQTGTADVIIEKEIDASSGYAIESVMWDGLDGNSAVVPSGTSLSISGRFTSGSLHVPLFDPEINSIGVNMLDVRPATSFDLIYWDDRSVTGLGSSTSVEFDGTNNQQHTWTDGNAILVNTWSFGYYQINTENVTMIYSCDPDGDGISGNNDDDSDNDGISDTEEGDFDNDTDGDLIPDYVDADVDGDGDVDVADNWMDSNNDGVNDNYDYDLDGVPNAIDLDSDNDGIADVIEAGGLSDANNDGTLNEGSGITDANSNGLADAYDADCTGAGGTNTYYATSQTTSGTVANAANALGSPDGNYANLQNNGDYIDLYFTNTITSGTTVKINLALQSGTNFNVTFFQSINGTTFTNQTQIQVAGTTPADYDYVLTADANYIRVRSDGNTDRYVYHTYYTVSTIGCGPGTALVPADQDGDGIPNYLDLDSDNDGIVDTWEAGGTASATTGQISGYTDTNYNGWNDAQEIVALSTPDTDADGVLPDYLDIDSDNDGIPDNYEGQSSDDHTAIVAGDTNGNGLLDIYDPTNGGTFITPVNTDGDSNYDFRDTDADGDGVSDLIEGWDANTNGYGDWDLTGSNNLITDESGYNTDTDGDGLWDIFDNTATTGIANIIGSDVTMQNTDGGDKADWQDTDDDNDGSLTAGEDINNNTDWTDDKTQGQGVSATVPDYLFRGDYDGDSLFDKDDADSDNDGIVDTQEANGEATNPSQDADNDGIPNYRDPDIAGSLANSADVNGDGVYDVYDTDLDGVPDFLDLDSDNDGLWDALEAYAGSIPNGLDVTSGMFDLNDPDNDGLMNYVDSAPASAGGNSTLANPDSDGDGYKDYRDIDSDGDGIVDLIESQSAASIIYLSHIDTDGDGIDDTFDPDNGGTLIIPVNTDGLDLQDYLDDDSDNDNVKDIVEGNDGNFNGFGDWDDNQNGLADEADFSTDSDGDGLQDAFDNVVLGNTGNELGSNAALQNTDGLDQKDFRDTDDDADGILTEDEDNNANGNYQDDNTNGQGISTIPDYLFNGDFDKDGIPNFDDIDDDNDGITDIDEGYENVNLDNGSFESPVIGASTYSIMSQAAVSGWNTTAADGNVEIWSTGFLGVTSFDGNQFMEINANFDAQLYQDVATEPGQLIFWQIAHRGRSGTDEFRILIGPTSGPVDNGTFATGNTNWAQYSGYYIVPPGQTTTRFAFESVSTASGDASIGNFIDDFSLFVTSTGTDVDGDGLPNYLDTDSDNDGIADLIESGGADADGDGQIDGLTDSDNDGIPDTVDVDETGGADSDDDGIDDLYDTSVTGDPDTDGDDIIDSADPDIDGDGLANTYDSSTGGTALTPADTDGDGINNLYDLDSDNDGIPDLTEAGGTDADGDGLVDDITDTDSDGLADLVDTSNGGTALSIPDSDFDRVVDYLDLDSDNDGITDAVENGGSDTNADGYIDDYASDSDNDGYADSVDPTTGGIPIANVDTDGDGLDDYIDLDADNDGYPDIMEGGGTDSDHDGRTSEQSDTDQDGIPNAVDVTQTAGTDTDGDGIDDNYDVTYTGGKDDDGDGIDNIYDEDRDGNGYSDAVEANPYNILDSDGDGHKNFKDIDSDNDGIVDVTEFGLTANASTGTINGFTDTDSDGFNDTQDGYLGTSINGSVTPVTPQNTDSSTEPVVAIVPNYLDIDSDNDGIPDLKEAQTKATYIALSGVDADNDGLDDAFDPTQGATLLTPVNTDGDANADYLDTDADGDGFIDRIEGSNANKRTYADWDTDADGNFDDSGYDTDTDEDGLLDIFDIVASTNNSNVTGTNAAIQDTDRDGSWDFQDLDDDNDGINTGASDTNATNDDPDNIIPDYLYGDTDADDDGIVNDNDLDADNDGVVNTEEDGGTGIDPSADTDNDGLYNFEDFDIDGDGTENTADVSTSGINTTSFTDTNGDGVIDQFDADYDGVPDYKDRDSDNDGIADLIEFGLTDANEDGTLNEGSGITDANGNGLDDSYDPDCNGEVSSGSGNATAVAVSNSVGNSDRAVGGNNNTYARLNATTDLLVLDMGTVLPATTSITVQVNASNATGNQIRISESNSTGSSLVNSVTFNFSSTTDEDKTFALTGSTRYIGIELSVDNGDIDVDFVSYSYSITECSGTIGSALTPLDTDGDGYANYIDLDSDNDGIVDNREAQSSTAYVAPVWVDSDGDGIVNVYDENTAVGNAINPINTDGTDNPDYLDADSDNDGVADVVEGWDADHDGFGDWDSDGDNDPTNEPGYSSDADGDGILYIFDNNSNAGSVANATGTSASIQDTDADTAPDYRDTDDDGDGILTSGEDNNSNTDWSDDFTQGGIDTPNYLFNPDFDGDGILDSLDPDSDGDGIPNSDEYAGVTYTDNSGPYEDDDADGIFNYLDPDATGFVDSNSDGVDDRLDHDRDGHPNFLDLDSDDDGIRDEDENTTTNYALTGTVTASSVSGTWGSPLTVINDNDTDGFGEAQNNHTNNDAEAYVQIDLGAVYDISTINVWNRTDCCSDRADNFYVFASASPFSSTSVAATIAQSGVTSTLQTHQAASPSTFNINTTARYIRVQLTETNYLHLAEIQVFSAPTDTDGDGNPNFLDLDSDNDGITDNREAQATSGFITITNADTDEDGLKDVYDADNGGVTITPVDTDADTTPDYLDTDSDDDNVADVIEGFDANKNGFSDLDTDLDGDLTDESGYGTDVDGDGLEKLYDNYSGFGIANIKGSKATLQDTDLDGIPDWRDNEDDSDGINTIAEDTNPADGLYYNDKTQGGGATPDYLFFNDTDDDGIADGQDLDSDNDGITDVVEANGTTYSGSNGPFFDDDGDGLFNYLDSDAANFVDANGNGVDDRVDQDGDGIPNFFDLDSDNDGIPDGVEANSGYLPTGENSNGQFPPSAADVDNDGLADNVDGGTTSTLLVPDTDGDGLPDFLDLDSDGDGITDLREAGGNDYNGDGKIDAFGDTDGDGLANSVDSDNSGSPLPYTDTDSDGAPDYIDIDSENDGIPEYEEGFYETDPNDFLNSYIDRVDAYNTANASSGYTLYDTDDASPANGKPDFLDDTDHDGIPNILDPDSPYYIDDDGDGLINLFDPDQGGVMYAGISGEPDRDSDGTPNIFDLNDIPLPLDFLSFRGAPVNNSVSLTWETTNEVNVSHFEVMYSSGNGQFTTVGVVDAVNEKDKLNTYRFIHKGAQNGYNYYRIKEVDYDGLYDFTEIINVTLAKNEINWVIYPNPSTDFINIQSNVIIPATSLVIYDASGKKVVDQEISPESYDTQVDIRTLPTGRYILLMMLPDGKEVFNILKK